MTNRTTEPWNSLGYSDIVVADRRDGDLAVEFANGDIVEIPLTSIALGEGGFSVDVDDETRNYVRLDLDDGRMIELNWTEIRSISDPRFSQELRRREAEQTHRIGLRLKALREDRLLSQRDLADRIGMSAPQLSKIEGGKVDLRFSTVQSILRAMGSELSDLADPHSLEISRKTLRHRAMNAGVSDDVMGRIVDRTPNRRLVETLSAAFGWALGDIVRGELRTPAIQVAVRLKANKNDVGLDSPLIHLGYKVAYACRSNFGNRYEGIPLSPDEIRNEAKDEHGRVTLSSLSNWAWSRGIPVVPLLGKGGFSAAVWSLDDGPAIVLKEARSSAVYWLFDLAHEIAHIVLGHIANESMVDVDSPAPSPQDDEIENAANEFALDLLVPEYERLLAEVRTRSQGSYLRFKFAVEDVATIENLSAGLLGMVAAYALQDIGEDKDRWGSASNLAKIEGEGRPKVESAARECLDMPSLSDLDRILVESSVLTGQ